MVHMSDILDRVKQKLLELTEQEERPIVLKEAGPTVLLVVGVNGVGSSGQPGACDNRRHADVHPAGKNY